MLSPVGVEDQGPCDDEAGGLDGVGLGVELALRHPEAGPRTDTVVERGHQLDELEVGGEQPPGIVELLRQADGPVELVERRPGEADVVVDRGEEARGPMMPGRGLERFQPSVGSSCEVEGPPSVPPQEARRALDELDRAPLELPVGAGPGSRRAIEVRGRSSRVDVGERPRPVEALPGVGGSALVIGARSWCHRLDANLRRSLLAWLASSASRRRVRRQGTPRLSIDGNGRIGRRHWPGTREAWEPTPAGV